MILLLRSCERSSERSGSHAALGGVIQVDQRLRLQVPEATNQASGSELQSHGRVAQIAGDMHHIPTGSHRAAPVRKRRESWESVLTPMKRFPVVGRLQ